MPEVWLARGGSYHQLGQHEKGLADRTKAIEMNPNMPDAWYARGSAYYLLGRYREAASDLSRALELQPDFPEAKNVFEKVKDKVVAQVVGEDRAKRAEVAVGAVEPVASPSKAAAVEAPPVVTPAVVPVQADMKPTEVTRPVKMVEPLRRVADLPASRAGAEEHNRRGRAFTQEHKYKEAVEELSEAIRLDSQFAQAYNARGYAYFLMHQYRQSLADLDEAIRLNPDYANAYQIRCAVQRAMR